MRIAAGLGLLVDGRPAAYWLGAAAIVGHVFPIISRFRGGKGVATGAGVMVVLHPLVTVVLAVVWFVLSRLTSKASIASIAVVALLPVGLIATGAPGWELAATIGLCVLVDGPPPRQPQAPGDPQGTEAVVVDVTRRRD